MSTFLSKKPALKKDLRERICAFLMFSSHSTRQIADHLDVPIEKALRIMKGLQREGFVEGTYRFYYPRNQGTSWTLNKVKWLDREVEVLGK